MIRAQMDGEDAELETDNNFLDLLPSEFALNKNYPIPFNPSTNLIFAVKERAITTLEIFNILGESVYTVVDEALGAGFYNYRLDMGTFASGMYLYKLTATNESGTQLFNSMKKMILLQ